MKLSTRLNRLIGGCICGFIWFTWMFAYYAAHEIKKKWEIFLLLIIAGIWYLSNINGAMLSDETLHAFRGYFFWKGDFSFVTNRPLGLYFIGLGEVFFGRTTFGAKIFPMLFGLGTIYLVYIITKEMSHRFYAFFAALITATIPLFALLSVSALLDTIFVFFILLLFYIAVKYSKTDYAKEQQRYIFLMGIVSTLMIATKLEGVCFVLVIALFILYREWGNIKKCQILRPRGILRKLKHKQRSFIVFIVMGQIVGIIIRWQLIILWNNAGADGRNQLLNTFGFISGILQNLDSKFALVFFIALGQVIFIILWHIFGLIGSETYRTLKTFLNGRKIDKTYQILLYPIGLLIGAIVYLPFLVTQPAKFITHFGLRIGSLMFGQSASSGSATLPVWTYFYWIYEYLGLMFLVGIALAILYTIIISVKRNKKSDECYLLLYFYFSVYLILSTLITKKFPKYIIPVAVLFSIYIATHIPKLVQLVLKTEGHKKFQLGMSGLLFLILLILPGSFHMAIDNPDIGYDSGYDDAAILVMDYANTDDETYVYAHDKIALEFYLPYPIPGNIIIIPYTTVSSDFSTDALGRPFRYYPEDEIYGLMMNGTIDLVIYPLINETQQDDVLLQHTYDNYKKMERINEDLVIYYLCEV